MKNNQRNYKEIDRQEFKYRDVEERLKDYKNIYLDYTDEFIKQQASRCQDCGIPFCHGFGCPIDNMIPDFNDRVYKDQWEDALKILHKTNHFPEITGTVCPALCEESCTLNVGMTPVTIKNIELAIVEKGFEKGWIKPFSPGKKTDKKIAIIGSGPAGLFAAKELFYMGHEVTVFEKDEKVGGFLRYGIPDFKLEKNIIDRRIKIMEQEGIEFKTCVNIGEDISLQGLKKQYDAVLIACGSREPRDLPIEGRDLKGIYFATDYLIQSNLKVDKKKIPENELIDAKDKNVLVIGGGDTGSDCIGTARRQGAKNILQVEIMPKPPEERSGETPWPMYAKKLRTSSSHKEGCERKWCILSKKFIGENGVLKKVAGCEIEWYKNDEGKWAFKEKPGTDFEYNAELVLLAMGFTHPEHTELLKHPEIELDNKGNIKADQFGYGKTNIDGIFAAGDAVRGASLVVWAFAHARDAAKMIDEYLMK